MKRNIIYLAGIALCAIGLFSGCDEDLPSYANLTVNAETLTINLDETTEGSFSIVEGNGGYKVNSSDATVATDRKSTRLNSSHMPKSRMPSSA